MLQQFWNTLYTIINIIKSAKAEIFNHSHDCGVSVCLYRRFRCSPFHPVKCLLLFTGTDLVSVHFSLIHFMSTIMRIHEIVLISEIYLKLISLYRHNILYYCLLDLENPKIPTWWKKERLYGTSVLITILQVGAIDYFTESTFRPTPNVQYSSDDPHVLYCTGLFHWQESSAGDEVLYLQRTVSDEAI